MSDPVSVDPVLQKIRERFDALISDYPPASTPLQEFIDARYDAGLAWVNFPEGFGGMGADRAHHRQVEAWFEEAGAPEPPSFSLNGLGVAMAGPTIAAFGTDAQMRRFLRPIWTNREIWCQLFSEPGAGSDLAGVATRAVRDGDQWRINGQKVWTSLAHQADYALLVARTDPAVPKHAGLTYFLVPMSDPGVEVRPLRQITGEAEFNEVFLTDVVISDDLRLGAVGQGWAVANATLMNERLAIGGTALPREGGMIGIVCEDWRARPEIRTAVRRDRLTQMWVDAELQRISAARHGQNAGGGVPGPEGSASKVAFSDLAQRLSGFHLEIGGMRSHRYAEPAYQMARPRTADYLARDDVYRYLRAKGNSIEGGTSEILRNIVAERMIGLPAEPRVDKDVPWKDVPR